MSSPNSETTPSTLDRIQAEPLDNHEHVQDKLEEHNKGITQRENNGSYKAKRHPNGIPLRHVNNKK